MASRVTVSVMNLCVTSGSYSENGIGDVLSNVFERFERQAKEMLYGTMSSLSAHTYKQIVLRMQQEDFCAS